MQKLRIVFMGTPEFSVTILDKILKNGYNIVGVVSTPDKPAGRGQKIHSSAVTQYAKQHHLNLLQPPKLKAKHFIDTLQSLEADIFVVVAFRILPEVIWSMPKLGTFNLHASLLPQYRGAAPINWAIINGEKQTGVTTFLLDKHTDTGNLLLQDTVAITPNETAGTLHDKLMNKGADLVIKTLKAIENKEISPQPQPKDIPLKYAPKFFRENTQIRWDDSLENIRNFVRGLNPYPTAWTFMKIGEDEKYLKIFEVEVTKTTHAYSPRQIIQKNKKIAVTHPEGFIWLKDLQLEGKRRMNAVDFANGIDVKDNVSVL